MTNFKILDDRYDEEALGLIPLFLSEHDPRPAHEQFNEAYAHGGGWMPMAGWRLGPVGEIMYPGDPPLQPIAVAALRGETIRVYEFAWVSITQPNGDFEIARMD